MLLAIDTATRMMSIALHDGTRLLSEQSCEMGNRQTIELAPAIRQMMTACEVEMDELTAVAVSVGPGSYTGVRIGISLAKGLASANQLPLIGINTLDILAYGQPYFQSGAGLVAVVQAGRGRVIVKSYRWRKGAWYSRTEPRLMNWETLLETIDATAYITGEISNAALDMIQDAHNDQILVAPGAYRLRRAGYLAECAWAELRAAGDDQSAFEPAKLLPIYIQEDAS